MQVEVVILADTEAVVEGAGTGLAWKEGFGDVFLADGGDGNATSGFADVGFSGDAVRGPGEVASGF